MVRNTHTLHGQNKLQSGGETSFKARATRYVICLLTWPRASCLTGTVQTVSSTSRPLKSWTCGLCRQCWLSTWNASLTAATWGINWTPLLTSRSGTLRQSRRKSNLSPEQNTARSAVYPLFQFSHSCRQTETTHHWNAAPCIYNMHICSHTLTHIL